MNRIEVCRRWCLVVSCVALGSASSGAAAEPQLDWSTVAKTEIMLFYPGQASWEWNLTEADHSGGPKVRKGKNCQGCHAGEETQIGEKIARGEKLEPAPVAGAHGALPLTVQVAQHDGALHWRFEWPARSSPRPAAEGAEHAAQLALLLDDGQLQEAKLSGCWGTCHDDLAGMASAQVEDQRTKYLGASRVKLGRRGGGDALKPESELAGMLAAGKFMELWLAELAADGTAKVRHGRVLEKRVEEAAQTELSARARREGERWTLELRRPLEVGKAGYKALRPGTDYWVGFAVHEGPTRGRYHYVSLDHKLRFDAQRAQLSADKASEKP